MSSTPGPWGPVAETGRRRSGPGTVLRLLLLVGLVGAGALAASAALLYRQADEALTRVDVDELTAPEDTTGAGPESPTGGRNVLVVGSDARTDGVADADDVATGDVEGQRADVIMYVAVRPDRDELGVLSLPRDLLVERDGRPLRLGETFAGGPGELVDAVQREYGLEVHHYAEVTFDGFLEAVETLGGVELCLEAELVDRDAGADLEAGCAHRSAEDALAFVRSRQGQRADLDRIERQQRFVRATLDELTDRRVLSDVPRLFDLVEDVAGNVTTDEALGLSQLLGLADQARAAIDHGLAMASLPAHPQVVGGREVLVPYGPGARAALEEIRTGTVADRGTAEERERTPVAIWSRNRQEGMEVVGSILHFGGFTDRSVAGPGPDGLDVGATTTVFSRAGHDDAADRVASLLGAPVRQLPGDLEMPAGARVVVAVGRDATASADLGSRLPEPDESIETRGAHVDAG